MSVKRRVRRLERKSGPGSVPPRFGRSGAIVQVWVHCPGEGDAPAFWEHEGVRYTEAEYTALEHGSGVSVRELDLVLDPDDQSEWAQVRRARRAAVEALDYPAGYPDESWKH
jgi:hypothetical protein